LAQIEAAAGIDAPACRALYADLREVEAAALIAQVSLDAA
jgi:hypothetical protein